MQIHVWRKVVSVEKTSYAQGFTQTCYKVCIKCEKRPFSLEGLSKPFSRFPTPILYGKFERAKRKILLLKVRIRQTKENLLRSDSNQRPDG